MLRKELKESDIPGRTTIRNRIEKIYAQHLEELTEEMKVCVFLLCIQTINFVYRRLLEKFLLQLMLGLIQIRLLLWLSLHIGFRWLQKRDQ